MIDPRYLPFTRTQMEPHFLVDHQSQLDYFEISAARYREFLATNPETLGIPISVARTPRQIEKDERFWTAATLKTLFEHPDRDAILESLLSKAYGSTPPIDGLTTWQDCVRGDLALYFEAQLPSPRAYADWLRQNLKDRHLIPYVRDAAGRDASRLREGPTHFDAILVNPGNGFSLVFESKVLSDVSSSVSFDSLRNQMVRCIDVMLERQKAAPAALASRDPDRSLFALLTPQMFRKNPHSRLYGWLFEEYRRDPGTIARDLPHRTSADWESVSRRLGWLTFEDIASHCVGACAWL
jgi:hypothetical protein